MDSEFDKMPDDYDRVSIKSKSIASRKSRDIHSSANSERNLNFMHQRQNSQARSDTKSIGKRSSVAADIANTINKTFSQQDINLGDNAALDLTPTKSKKDLTFLNTFLKN
jgi:hypothetical protein